MSRQGREITYLEEILATGGTKAHDADKLIETYESGDYNSLYSHQSHFDFVSGVTPVIAMWRGGWEMRRTLEAYVQDQKVPQNSSITSSYGIRCLLKDIYERGAWDSPDPSRDTIFVVESVFLWELTSGKGIHVFVYLRERESKKCYYMEIRYKWEWRDIVLNVLKCTLPSVVPGASRRETA